jgi:hypothetical protein
MKLGVGMPMRDVTENPDRNEYGLEARRKEACNVLFFMQLRMPNHLPTAEPEVL